MLLRDLAWRRTLDTEGMVILISIVPMLNTVRISTSVKALLNFIFLSVRYLGTSNWFPY